MSGRKPTDIVLLRMDILVTVLLMLTLVGVESVMDIMYLMGRSLMNVILCRCRVYRPVRVYIVVSGLKVCPELICWVRFLVWKVLLRVSYLYRFILR